MKKIILKEGETICLYYDGIITFCACKGLAKIEKEFELDLETEGCSFYINNSYVGRIICQGVRVYDKDQNEVYTEGKVKNKR